MVKPYYIKSAHSVKEKKICSQMFYKIVVLESSQEENCVGVIF